MFQKTRIRSLLAIAALTGATVLGGSSLAGAGSHPAEEDAPEIELVETTTDGGDLATAAGDATTAGSEDDEDLDDGGDDVVTGEADRGDDAAAEDAEYRNHGQAVAAAAHACQDDTGDDENRGQCVSAVARTNGAEEDQQREEDVSEEKTSEETDAEPVEAEAPVDETEADDVEAQDADEADATDDQPGKSGDARA